MVYHFPADGSHNSSDSNLAFLVYPVDYCQHIHDFDCGYFSLFAPAIPQKFSSATISLVT